MLFLFTQSHSLPTFLFNLLAMLVILCILSYSTNSVCSNIDCLLNIIKLLFTFAFTAIIHYPQISVKDSSSISCWLKTQQLDSLQRSTDTSSLCLQHSIGFHIDFKILLLTSEALNGLVPKDMSD